MNKQPSIITATILFILGAGVFYFLDLPQYDKDKKQKDKIDNFLMQKKAQESHREKIAEIGLDIKSLDWASKEAIIAPNFSSSPFFVPKIELFFKDLVSRSNMKFESFSVQKGGAAVQVEAPQDQPIEPVEDGSKNLPKNQSGVLGIKGPVKRNGFNLVVQGKYEELKNLLIIFEKQAYIISVKSLSFGESTDGKFKFTISGDIYSY